MKLSDPKIFGVVCRWLIQGQQSIFIGQTRGLNLTSSLKSSAMKNSADVEVIHVTAVRAKAENFMSELVLQLVGNVFKNISMVVEINNNDGRCKMTFLSVVFVVKIFAEILS